MSKTVIEPEVTSADSAEVSTNTVNGEAENTETEQESTTENNVSGPTLPGVSPDLLAGLMLEIEEDVITGDAATRSAHKGRKAAEPVIDPWWATRLGYLYTKMSDTEPAAVMFKGTAGDWRKNFTGPKSSVKLWTDQMATQGIKVKVSSAAAETSPNPLLPSTDSNDEIHRLIRVLPA